MIIYVRLLIDKKINADFSR